VHHKFGCSGDRGGARYARAGNDVGELAKVVDELFFREAGSGSGIGG
jgi:hypothetical protein